MANQTPNVNGIPVISKWIRLRHDCEMVSEYEGRGIPCRSKVFPAGTKAHYSTFPYNGRFAARSGEEITHWKHTVRVQDGKTTFICSKTIEA